MNLFQMLITAASLWLLSCFASLSFCCFRRRISANTASVRGSRVVGQWSTACGLTPKCNNRASCTEQMYIIIEQKSCLKFDVLQNNYKCFNINITIKLPVDCWKGPQLISCHGWTLLGPLTNCQMFSLKKNGINMYYSQYFSRSVHTIKQL